MEQASLRLMQGLMQRGHTCRVLSLNPLGALQPRLQAAGIPAEGLPYSGRGGWRSWPLLRRKLAGSSADALLMTGHNLMATLALGSFCLGHRTLAIHFHHTGVKPAWQWRLIYRVACARFQAVTFPSDFVRQEAEHLWPPVGAIAHTVRNPLPLPPLPSKEERCNARRRLGIPEDALVVGNAGWLIARKRFDIFLQVARKVVERLPGALFVIAGDGPEKANLDKLAGELGVASNLRWLGWQEDLRAFYRSLDAFLFNSDWDAMGLTPLEALGYGVPVVASVMQGGLGEVLQDGAHATLLGRHDVPALARAVVALLQDPSQARAIARRGRDHIAALSDPEPIVIAYERLLLGRTSAAPG